LGWLAAALIFSKLDPLPHSPPAALFRFNAATAGLCLIGAAAVALVLSVIVERSSTSRPLPELLRDAD
jgi:hypothetical protein